MADLSAIPQCGASCLISSLSVSACAAIDTACLCADQGFTDVVTSCVRSNCTVKESLIVQNATYSGCGFPEPNQDTTLLVLTVVLLGLQTVFFALRMLCRAVRIAPWGWDDTTIVIAFILTTGFAAGSHLEGRAGLGRNIWTLRPEQIDDFLKIFYIFETIYSFVLALIKTSICFLYTRIFPGPRFRVAVWATQAFILALLVTFVVADGFQCHPISFFWLGWDGEHEGSCFDLNAFAYAHAIINIVLDVWMLALPASQVWSLNMPMRKKAGVLAMFGFGIFLTIISIVRLQSLREFANTNNPSSDFFGVAIWSSIEITAGLMVACMPAARLFVMHHAHRCYSSDRSRLASTPYPPRSGNHNSTGSPFAARTLSQRLHKTSPFNSLVSQDLDRNRRYSMRVTVTSNGKFGASESMDSQYELAEEGIRIPDFPEDPGSARLPPPGMYLGLPDRLLTPNESSQMEKAKQIWITQDVSITRESMADRAGSFELREGPAETKSRDA